MGKEKNQEFNSRKICRRHDGAISRIILAKEKTFKSKQQSNLRIELVLFLWSE